TGSIPPAAGPAGSMSKRRPVCNGLRSFSGNRLLDASLDECPESRSGPPITAFQLAASPLRSSPCLSGKDRLRAVFPSVSFFQLEGGSPCRESPCTSSASLTSTPISPISREKRQRTEPVESRPITTSVSVQTKPTRWHGHASP